MTEIVQNLAPKILEEIKKANNILLHCHLNADADSIGGALAMMQVLETMGKKVTVIRGDSELSASFSCLPGFEKIVHKNFFEVDLAQFDLFLIQDSGSLNRVSNLAPIVFPKNLKTITIDHHATNENYADINLVDSTYPATCQIIHDLFVAWNVEITSNIAKCLMLGIYFDTGGFRFNATTSGTFKVAGHLAEIAPNYSSLISFVEDSKTPGVIAFQALALSSVKLYCGNHVAISGVSHASLKDMGIKESEIYPDIAAVLKSVVGWDIGVKIVETEPGKVKIGFRTRDEKVYDVSKIAVACGGGGHKGSSGVRMNVSVEEAVKRVVEVINSIYPELGK